MSMHALNRRWLVALATLVLPMGGTALAQPVLITSPATVGATDTQIKDQQSGQFVNLSTAQITVQGTTLTVNGRHAIASLSVVSAGVVTHSNNFTYDYSGGAGTDVVHGMYLIVSGDVGVQSSGAIDVSGRGYGHGDGPGDGIGYYAGGGYGGSGGDYGGYLGGAPYGSASQPTDLGSSGQVGIGGGAVRLIVSGTLTVDGSVLANGGNGGAYGSGSGGSIWISAGTLTGVGSIRANGGSSTSNGGGGGGGRIAIDAGSTTFSGATQAFGGQNSATGGLYNGGAGTIYWYGTPAVLIYDNGGQSGPSLTQPVGTLTHVGTMIVRNGASLSHRRGGGSNLSINVTGDVVIEAGGAIDVSGRGYWHGDGPGDGTGYYAGGGYGGRGGVGYWNGSALGGAPYGSASQPTDLGSSGHVGMGGGAVRLIVSGTLTVDGSVLANGGNGGAYGSGSGGSIWISAGTLTGVGSIRANGGSSTDYGGGGGGGRIAVYVCEMTFQLDETSVLGGSSSYLPAYFGDPGTLFESDNTVAILSQPSSQVVCAEGSGAFSIIASDIGSFTYQWQWQPAGAATTWVDLVAGDNAEVGGVPVVHVADVNGDTLGVVPLAGYVDFAPRAFRCVVANACGEVISDQATLTVCAGDFNCDGYVNGDDYDAFAELFENGEIGADVNNDGYVNGDDYDLFAEHFEAGC